MMGVHRKGAREKEGDDNYRKREYTDIYEEVVRRGIRRGGGGGGGGEKRREEKEKWCLKERRSREKKKLDQPKDHVQPRYLSI